MSWKTVDEAYNQMQNAMDCHNCVGFKIDHTPNAIETAAAKKCGVSWVYQNGIWVWPNPKFRGY